MYFISGVGVTLSVQERMLSSGGAKTLLEESLTTEVLTNILEQLEAVTK